eukprot:8334256-Alexandrium_andersonii.AAC.1
MGRGGPGPRVVSAGGARAARGGSSYRRALYLAPFAPSPRPIPHPVRHHSRKPCARQRQPRTSGPPSRKAATG